MDAYDGCIPVTVYMVQKYVEGCIFGKWVNINGFSDKKKAEALMWLLEHETKHKSKKTMKTEENKRMLALSFIVADLKAENMELEQRVHQLIDDYNNVVRQLNGNKKRNGKDSSKPAIAEMQQMREHCDHPERMNNGLDRFAKAMHEFVIDKNLYMKKDSECPFRPGCVHVGSLYCLECGSCLGVIEGVGVICDKKLAEACAVFPSYD